MNLSPQQLAAVTAPEQSVVVLSTAGSGKTRVLVERIRHLLRSGVRAEQIAVVTFTSAAAHEIQERLSKCPVCGGSGSYFTGVVGPHEQREVQECACGPAPRLGYAGTLHGLMLRAIRAVPSLCGYSAAPTVANEALSEELWAEAIMETRCRESMKALRACAARPLPVPFALSKLESCALHYRNKLVESGLVDFDLILLLGLELIRSGQFPYRFEHLLVDELQDSSAMDALIYGGFPTRCFFGVGDDFQAIYGFRGGDPSYLLNLSRDSTVGTYKLEGCYRCSAEICSAASAVISHVQNRTDKQTISIPGPRGPVLVTRFASYPEEVASIAMSIAKHAADGSAPLNEVAVLLRTNALVDVFRDGLKAHGIQLRERRGELLPEDWSKAQSIVALCAEPDNDRLLLACLKMTESADVVKRLKLRAAEQMSSCYECYGFTIPSDLQTALAWMVKAGVGLATMEAVERLAAELPDQSLADLAVAMVRERPESEMGDGVHVGTMHSAKGREWNDVYLPAFEQGIIPAKRDADEERRLTFVSFTRARNRLHLSHCAERPNQFGSRKLEPAVPSCFIQEAGL